MPVRATRVRRPTLVLVTLAPAALLTVLTTACSTARMALPEPLATVQPVPVEGRGGWRPGKRIVFGEWSTDEVDRSRTRGGDLSVFGFEGSRREQAYAFALREADAHRWDVDCGVRVRENGFNVRGVTVTPEDMAAVRCLLTPAGGQRADAWRLELDEERERPFTGILFLGERRLTVTGTNRIAGGVLPAGQTTGYRIEDGARLLAAVDVISEGALYWAPEIRPDERGLVAAAAAAVLLMEDLRASINRE